MKSKRLLAIINIVKQEYALLCEIISNTEGDK